MSYSAPTSQRMAFPCKHMAKWKKRMPGAFGVEFLKLVSGFEVGGHVVKIEDATVWKHSATRQIFPSQNLGAILGDDRVSWQRQDVKRTNVLAWKDPLNPPRRFPFHLHQSWLRMLWISRESRQLACQCVARFICFVDMCVAIRVSWPRLQKWCCGSQSAVVCSLVLEIGFL